MDLAQQFDLVKQKVSEVRLEQDKKALELARLLLTECMPQIMEAASRGEGYALMADLIANGGTFFFSPNNGILDHAINRDVHKGAFAEQLALLLKSHGVTLGGCNSVVTKTTYINWL